MVSEIRSGKSFKRYASLLKFQRLDIYIIILYNFFYKLVNIIINQVIIINHSVLINIQFSQIFIFHYIQIFLEFNFFFTFFQLYFYINENSVFILKVKYRDMLINITFGREGN